MEVLHARCAGLDVHKDTVVACVRLQVNANIEQQVKTFGTTTTALLELSEWLSQHEVTHVAMESTGIYWKPVWHVLEGNFELILANAAHIKNVPGRKTDVNDSMWIANLLAHGLIRGSFVPPTPTQELRALTRTRKQLVRERASHVLRIQRVLEDANVKLSSVLTDVLGASGRAIIEAFIAGVTDTQKLLELVNVRVKADREHVREALRGRVSANHRFLLKLHLDQIDSLDDGIAQIDKEVGERLEPFRRKAQLLETIPGVSSTIASVILSEVGEDMSRFPTSSHLVSWTGLCPQSDESAGKRRSTRVRKGAPWLKTVLAQAAWANARSKKTGGYLHAQFLRLKARRGLKKAILAVAASIVTGAFYILRDNVPWKDLGRDYFDRQDPAKAAKKHLARLRALGFQVELTAVSA